MVKNFNSHARVGRDLLDTYGVTADKDFNSHARVGRDPDALEHDEKFGTFQLTRPCRA